MATNAKALQDYFANLDDQEAADAQAADLNVDQLRAYRRDLPKGSQQDVREMVRVADSLNARDVTNNLDWNELLLKSPGGDILKHGQTMTPPSIMPLSERARPNPRAAAGLERMGLRLNPPVDMPETVPSLSMPSGVSAKTTDFASLQKVMSPGALKAPEAQPIPVANASMRVDAPVAVTTALPPTTDKQPAGKPESMGTPDLSAPSSEGAGGDSSERDLYLARLAAQTAAGFGGMGAGKNIDMGIADTLGERLKQVQALRAKREEQGLTDAQERANNRAQVEYLMQRFPDRREALAGLLDMTKSPNFSQMLRVEEQVALDRAKKATEEVKPVVALRGVEVKEAGQGEKEKEGESKRREREARIAKVYNDMSVAGAKLALDERKTIEQAQQSKDPYKKLENLNTIADKKEFGGFTTLAGDLGDLERVAPGFVTRGEVPEWLTREQQLLGQNWPTSTDPRVVDFLAAYGKVANEERHRQYGSAQTDGELRAFMQQLNANPLSAGPQVLAQQVKRFGQAAGRVAKGRLTRYNNVFGAENVDTVFAPEWKPLFSEGGVFAAQGSPFAVVSKRKAQPANTTTMLNENGKPQYVPNDQVQAAEAAGWKRE